MILYSATTSLLNAALLTECRLHLKLLSNISNGGKTVLITK